MDVYLSNHCPSDGELGPATHELESIANGLSQAGGAITIETPITTGKTSDFTY